MTHAPLGGERVDDSRLPGGLAIAGAALMLLGAALWAATGADLDRALMTGEVPAYLVAAAEHRSVLTANLCVWLIGALVLGAAGTTISGIGSSRSAIHRLAGGAYLVGTPLAVSAFLAWLALIVQGSGDPGAVEIAIAEVVGWYAYRSDAVATALLVGIGPALIGIAGREDWAPAWLFRWGLLAGLTGLLSFVPYFIPTMPLGVTMIIVPVGLGWTLVAGFVLLRRGQRERGQRFEA